PIHAQPGRRRPRPAKAGTTDRQRFARGVHTLMTQLSPRRGATGEGFRRPAGAAFVYPPAMDNVRGAARLVLFAVASLGLAARPAGAAEPYATVVLRDVKVAMRDGVRLATDVSLPARAGTPAPGRFPAVLERTPYDKNNSDDRARDLVPYGYVFVAQDVRGRFGSEGRWRPMRDDVKDGFDTTALISPHPWSDGGVGTVGTSYPGGTQHALALGGPPALKALVPVDALSDCGRYGIRHNGAFELRFFNWIFNFGFAPLPLRQPGIAPESADAVGALRDHVREYLRGLPLRPGTT